MDFMNRGVQPNRQNPAQPAPGEVPNHNTSPEPKPKKGKLHKIKGSKIAAIASIILLFSVTALIIAVAVKIFIAEPNKEQSYVNEGRLQAVFLNNGQVYFGNINEINNDFIKLSNIYYLRVNQQVQPGRQQTSAQNGVSLVKLGCELHGPEDSMIINRSEITFWENLKEDGQVAKAVAEYVKQNPNGQNCTQQTQQQSGNSDSGSSSATTGDTNNTSTSTTNNTNQQNNSETNSNSTNNNNP